MVTTPKLLSIRWTGLRLLAAVVLALGVWGTASALTGVDRELEEALAAAKSGGLRASVTNPVVHNIRRQHAASLENQVKDYRVNLAAVAAFFAYVMLSTIHFAGLVWRIVPAAPVSAGLGALFLGASGICGFLLGVDVLKVSEFAFAAAGAQPAEREWLQGGMAFLNQLHLVFVTGWVLFLAFGWFALGVGTRRLAGGPRFASYGLLLGPMVLLASIGARHWLPTYGATAPAGVLLALVSSAGCSRERRRREGTATSAGAPPNARA